MTFKKVLCLLIVGVMVLSVVACGGQKAEPKAEPETTQTTAKSTEPDAEQTTAPEKITLKFWHIYGGTDPNAESLGQIVKTAESQYNVTLEVDTAEAEAYKTKLKAAVAANEAPDIFLTWGRGFLKPFVDVGKVLNLEDYMSDGIRNNVVEGSFTNFSYDGKAYAFPDANAVAVLFCNKEMFDANDIKIPETWDEFITAVKAFKSKGIDSLAVGAKDVWTLAMYHDILALRSVGPAKLSQALEKKDFSDPGFLEAAKKLKTLVDLGAFPKGAAALSRDEGEVGFMQGQIPMMMQGSWTAARVYKDTSKVQDKIVPVRFPVIDPAISGIDDFTGGGQTAFAVSAATKDKERTVQVAEFIAQKLASSKFTIGGGISPYKDAPSETTNPLFLETFKLSQNATSLTIWWDTLLEGKDSTTYLNKLQELFIGKITPEQYIAELNKMGKE
jgi:raffinose/stachyose/melibiose transport system substrate-binding protein